MHYQILFIFWHLQNKVYNLKQFACIPIQLIYTLKTVYGIYIIIHYIISEKSQTNCDIRSINLMKCEIKMQANYIDH